ncbi:MAG: hypothetical protein KKB34_18730 [Bacteroidetes bacterium]|nr:hypothetical protein [Bacteroidota bacterium]
MRKRVSNIDLWETTWQLVETPVNAFEKIIFAEHKNFISFLLILGGFKYFLLSNFIFNIVLTNFTYEYNLFSQSILGVVVVTLLIIILSFLLKRSNLIFGIQSKFLDNSAVFIYALIPLIISFVILFPIEYGIFGGHWVYFNPSPFLINFVSALILAILELFFLLWHLFLLVVGVYVQTRDIKYSVIWGIFAVLVLIIFMGILPAFLVILL